MTTIKHTTDIPCRFDVAFLELCAELEIPDPRDLLGVMMSESGCRADAQNPHGKATGLIQFMPDTLRNLGWREGPDAFRHLDAVQQLPYVGAYFHSWRSGKPWSSAGRLYQATFLPGTMGELSRPDDVLCQRGGRLGWAYEANAVFDANGDQRITISELTDSVFRACRGPRWLELLERLGLEAPIVELRDADGDGVPELSTIAEVQTALGRIGFDAGPADGIMGPRTRNAIIAFQTDRHLKADGICGPITRAELALAVATSA